MQILNRINPLIAILTAMKDKEPKILLKTVNKEMNKHLVEL